MKKFFLAILTLIFLISFAEAKNPEYIDKIIKLYNLKTNNALEFNATKSSDGYNFNCTFKNAPKIYKTIFNSKPMHVIVDDGPLVTSPHFTMAKAGLVSKGSVLNIFNEKLLKDIKKSLKSEPKYSYQAVVSFSNKLEEKLTIDPIKIDNNDTSIELSKIYVANNFDLDSFTGKSSLKIDNLIVKTKNKSGILEAKDIKFISKIPQEPIDNIMLFADSKLSLGEVDFKATDKNKNPIAVKFSANIEGITRRVDKDYLDFAIKYNFKALDANTIALAKGIKSSSLNLELKNLGIKGVEKFILLSQKLDKLNSKLIEATQKNDSQEMQKVILEQQELLNSGVDIFNKTFIGGKSRVVLDLNLKSDKESFAKVNLLYKGEPISGNIQSLVISLMAQQLNLFDGDFEVQLDSSLATSINPLAIMGLDLLKSKGFATEKNGLYHLKGQLKSGKIVINGKAYTIPELTKALF